MSAQWKLCTLGMRTGDRSASQHSEEDVGFQKQGSRENLGSISRQEGFVTGRATLMQNRVF